MEEYLLSRLEIPTQLEWLRELNKRGALDEEMENDWHRLEAGHAGEQYVLRVLEEFGEAHWVVLRNVWLKYNGNFECDLVVLTRAGLYTFEVKNYSGHYVYRDLQCFMNGEKIGHHAINQAQRSHVQLEKLVRMHLPQTNVHGALAFVGEHHTVEVHDQVKDLQVVRRNALRNYVWGMAKHERMHQGPWVDVETCFRVLEHYASSTQYSAGPLTAEINARLRKGICCSECGRFDLSKRDGYLVCGCGTHEPRENAVVRTICEYGVIHFEEELVTTHVLDFFGGQISRTNLTVLLKKHFKMTGRNKGAKFINKRQPFVRIAKEFNLPKKRYCILP